MNAAREALYHIGQTKGERQRSKEHFAARKRRDRTHLADIAVEDGDILKYLGFNKYVLNGVEYPLAVAGDVNDDNEVDVRDITALIDIIMNSGTNPRADVNGDQEIDVRDITALIDIIMAS